MRQLPAKQGMDLPKSKERREKKKKALKKLVDSYSSIPRKCDILEKMIYVYIPSKA